MDVEIADAAATMAAVAATTAVAANSGWLPAMIISANNCYKI